MHSNSNSNSQFQMCVNELGALLVIYGTHDQLGALSLLLSLWVYLSCLWFDDFSNSKSYGSEG